MGLDGTWSVQIVSHMSLKLEVAPALNLRYSHTDGLLILEQFARQN